MIGQLIELSAFGRTLKCCRHLKGYVGLVVDQEENDATVYWIDWIGIDKEDAYPTRESMFRKPNVAFALHNGFWNRRDIRMVKNK